MFKRVERKRKRREEEEALGLDEETKEALGINNIDTDSDESASEEEEEEEEESVQEEDEEENDSDSESEDSLPFISLQDALNDPIYPVDGEEEHACLVCPGKFLKTEEMKVQHKTSKAHTRRFTRFKELAKEREEDKEDTNAWEIVAQLDQDTVAPPGELSKRQTRKRDFFKARRAKAKEKKARKAEQPKPKTKPDVEVSTKPSPTPKTAPTKKKRKVATPKAK
ncbi:hypothetical protein AAF712_013017 [Marasmius tenuissimus]|uniref:Uncharacterized protein n=1 Tax=Marasmius tenuissimus TaxID=585030 RepID=A0ABR2ZG25_9AGAR|nr:hypothetical protein PM082_015899 [Marasmius tenuissimus]